MRRRNAFAGLFVLELVEGFVADGGWVHHHVCGVWRARVLCVAGLLGVLLGVQLTAHLLSCVTKIVIHSFVACFFFKYVCGVKSPKGKSRKELQRSFFF